MTKFITAICIVIFIASASFGQGNLQFNQVINVSLGATTTGTGFSTLGTITVPAGKVWKVERTSLTQDYLGDFYPVYGSGSRAFIGEYVVWNSSSSYPQQLFPLWLSEGAYNVTGYTGGTLTYTLAVSAIEFNVIP